MAVDRPTCTSVHSPPSPISIQLPGGITLQSMPLSNGLVASELNYVQSMMAQLAPALAAMQPIFILIDTVIALKDTVASIPGLIVGDVDTFTEALQRVIDGVSKLAGMTPQVSIPVLVRDLVAFLAAVLRVLETRLDTITEAEQEAQAILALAATAPDAYKADLQIQGECAEEQAAAMLEHAVAATGPIQGLLTIIGVLSQLAQGIPGMPEMGDMTGQTTAQVKETITTLREALELIDI